MNFFSRGREKRGEGLPKRFGCRIRDRDSKAYAIRREGASADKKHIKIRTRPRSGSFIRNGTNKFVCRIKGAIVITLPLTHKILFVLLVCAKNQRENLSLKGSFLFNGNVVAKHALGGLDKTAAEPVRP